MKSKNQFEQQGVAGESRQFLGAPKPAKVEVASKIDAGKQTSLALSIPKGLAGDTFVITITGKEGTLFQATVHRPIGFTNLASDAWVCSATEDIHPLLGRAEHPGAKKHAQLLDVKRIQVLVSAGYLAVDNGQIFWLYPDGKSESQTEIFQLADQRLRVEKQNHLAAHEAAQVGKPKSAKYRGFPGSKDDFLLDYQKKHLAACNTYVKQDGSVLALKRELQAGYETRGGPNRDRPQVPLLRSGNQRQAVDRILKLLFEDAIDDGPDELRFAMDSHCLDMQYADKGEIGTSADPPEGETKGVTDTTDE